MLFDFIFLKTANILHTLCLPIVISSWNRNYHLTRIRKKKPLIGTEYRLLPQQRFIFRFSILYYYDIALTQLLFILFGIPKLRTHFFYCNVLLLFYYH